MDMKTTKKIVSRYLAGDRKKAIVSDYGLPGIPALIAIKRQQCDRALDKDYLLQKGEKLRPCLEIPFYVSNHGNVFNVFKERIVLCQNLRYLSLPCSHVNYPVHRLVLEAFCGASHLHVNHKDGNKHNNHLSNLEYCTPKENAAHSINVLGNKVHGSSNGHSKIDEDTVLKIYQEYVPRSREHGLHGLAKKYGVDYTNVHLIVAGKIWKHVTGGIPKKQHGKLSPSAVEDIRKDYTPWGEKSQIHFATKYGVSKATIKNVIDHKGVYA